MMSDERVLSTRVYACWGGFERNRLVFALALVKVVVTFVRSIVCRTPVVTFFLFPQRRLIREKDVQARANEARLPFGEGNQAAFAPAHEYPYRRRPFAVLFVCVFVGPVHSTASLADKTASDFRVGHGRDAGSPNLHANGEGGTGNHGLVPEFGRHRGGLACGRARPLSSVTAGAA